MFHLETEDMLPRLAPKPSPDVPIGVTDGIIRPQVPEVSILFGQQDGNLQQQTLNGASQPENKTFPQQTYAAWKKQMMPKVTYPAPANMVDMPLPENTAITHDYNSPRTNLYPMRSTTAPPLNMIANINSNGYIATPGGIPHQMAYLRNLESCGNNVYQQTQHLPAMPSRVSLSQLPNGNPRDVLTICAGTQTDIIVDSSNYLQNPQSDPIPNWASRKDVENIQQILDEIKIEQQRLLKMFETFLFSFHSQMATKPQRRDIGVQVVCIESERPSGNLDSIQANHPVLKNKFQQHLKLTNNILQTPRSKPIAQSTAYRSNSPQFHFILNDLPELITDASNQQLSNKPVLSMPKSASDTSLAMNELALKYLPNEKLTELLKELNMDCPLAIASTNIPTTPARVSDKFEKSPSDISNASYKYLKKYRLLPEDHEENGNNIVNNPRDEKLRICDQNKLLPCHSQNNLRNEAIIQRQIPANKGSPYVGVLPVSPLVRSSPTPPPQSVVTQHVVNLENIKHKSKFL